MRIELEHTIEADGTHTVMDKKHSLYGSGNTKEAAIKDLEGLLAFRIAHEAFMDSLWLELDKLESPI